MENKSILQRIVDHIQGNSGWDEGCFYYKKISDQELGDLLTLAEEELAKRDNPQTEVIALRTALANIHEELGRAMNEAETEVASETMGGNAVKLREAMVHRAAVQGLLSGLHQIHPERIRDRIADLELCLKRVSESSCYFEDLLNKYRTKYGVELEPELALLGKEIIP